MKDLIQQDRIQKHVLLSEICSMLDNWTIQEEGNRSQLVIGDRVRINNLARATLYEDGLVFTRVKRECDHRNWKHESGAVEGNQFVLRS